jgi:predicted PurR-regulated permease PerM
MTTDAASPGPPASDPPLDMSSADLVPGWLARLAAIGWRVLVTVALITLIGLAARYLVTVTGSILVALIVAATAYPLLQSLRERGWPRARAAGAVSLLALIVVVVTITLIALAFIPHIADLLRLVNDGLRALSAGLTELGVPAPLIGVVNRAASDLQTWLLTSISELVSPIATFVTILIIGGFLMFYVLEDGDRAWATATSEIDDWRAERLTGRGMLALEQVGGYLRGTAVGAVTDAVTSWVFLTVLGVPLAGPLAVLVFIGGFIPYLGGIVTGAILLIVTLATQGWIQTGILLGLIALTKVFEHRVLEPRSYGPMARIPVGVAVVALPAGAALFGVIGLFATVPVVVMIYAFGPAIVESLGSISQEPSSNPMVPLWLDRLGQWSWRALVVLGLGWLLVQVAIAPFFSVPIVLAAITAPALYPLVGLLRARGLSPTMATLTVTFATIAIVVVVMAISIVSIATSLPEMIGQASNGANSLGSVAVDLVKAFGDGLIGTAAAILTGIAGVILALAISVLLIFLFLRDGSEWWARVVTMIPANRRERVDQVGKQSAGILRGTMIGTALVSLAGGVLQFITMWILGLPLAFPIGVLMFFFGFIPYIGGAIVTALGFLVAVSVGSQLDVVLMAIFTVVFNIVQGNIVTPLVYGRTVSIHPAVVLLAVPAGGAIAGLLGMVIVVPIISIISHTWRTVLHLFDPEDEQPPVAAPVAAPQPRPTPRPTVAPAAEGAEP